MTRAAQDTNMLYQCLVGSLSKADRMKVMVWEEQYKIKGKPSGNLLLKIIIRESHIDINATTTSIRNQLSSLDQFITTIGCDITKLNAHVQMLLEVLASRGETTHYLLSTYLRVMQRRQIPHLRHTLKVNRKSMRTVLTPSLPPS